MDTNHNPTSKYRRESLDQSLDQSEIEKDGMDQKKQELSDSFKYYIFIMTGTIYLIYVSHFCVYSNSSKVSLVKSLSKNFAKCNRNPCYWTGKQNQSFWPNPAGHDESAQHDRGEDGDRSFSETFGRDHVHLCGQLFIWNNRASSM